jgi:outer membrane biosynthesis protein TonB
MSGDPGGLTAEEINRVVKARAGVFRACYQKELNRSPGIGGKVVIYFVIGGDGRVQSAKTAGASTMRNENVESCVNSNIMRLVFPAKGGLATVNYPFLFQPGG